MELYAIRYGENFTYANYGTIYKGAKNPDEKVPEFIFLYYLAKYNGRIVLFDTGFRDERTASSMGITLKSVENEIKNVIGDLFCIDIIFITHSHFDHINNLDLYNKASIIMSKPEYDIAINESPEPVKAHLKSNSNNITLIKDEYVFDEKFRFKVIGGHTPGSSVIYFDYENKNYVITGDECYAIENILKNIPNGNYTNSRKNAEFISDAHNKKLIPLPYHDNKIFSNYKRVSTNIAKII